MRPVGAELCVDVDKNSWCSWRSLQVSGSCDALPNLNYYDPRDNLVERANPYLIYYDPRDCKFKLT
jgi:hypothetical protein